MKFGSAIDFAMPVETIKVGVNIKTWFNIDIVETISNWYKAYRKYKIANKETDRNKLEETKCVFQKLSLVKKDKTYGK